MSILDLFKRGIRSSELEMEISKAVDKPVFVNAQIPAYPGMKSGEYLKQFTGWVYTCTDAIAEAVSNIDLYLARKTKGSDYKRVDAHEVLDTLEYVNEFMTFSDLIYTMVAHILLDGNAFWYLVRDGNGTGKIREIWPLQPNLVTINKDAATFIRDYTFKSGGKDIKLGKNEVIHFKKPNPLDAYRGIGVVQAAALAIDTDNGASNYNRVFFENAAIPAGVLSTDQKLTAEQFARIKEQWKQNYQGSQNANKTALLESGLKFDVMSLTHKDMDFLEQRKFSRDEILAMFKVPKTIIGITEDVNRANAEASKYVFASNVVDPMMNRIASALSEFLLPMYSDLKTNAKFFYENPVPEDEALNTDRRRVGVEAGFYTINEVRAEEGLDAVEGGDIPLVGLGRTPLNMVGMMSSAIPTTDPNATKAVTKDVSPAEADPIEKRVQFIRQEIKNRAGRYLNVYNRQKRNIVDLLKSRKSGVVTKNLLNLIFEDWNTYIQLWEGEVTEAFKASIDHAGREIVTQVSAGVSFDLLNPRVVSWVKTRALEDATSINNTTKEEIRKRLLAGIEEGSSTTQIADSIQQYFDTEGEWRALRIARTEVIKAYAEGSIEGMRQSGVVRAKRWLTANDDRVEEECLHNQADGEVGLEDVFSSGNAAPPVHPNCRCTLTWVV